MRAGGKDDGKEEWRPCVASGVIARDEIAFFPLFVFCKFLSVFLPSRKDEIREIRRTEERVKSALARYADADQTASARMPHVSLFPASLESARDIFDERAFHGTARERGVSAREVGCARARAAANPLITYLSPRLV